MNQSISIRPQAETDLAEQFAYYMEKADAEIAEKFLSMVQYTAEGLLAQPGKGVKRLFRNPKLQHLRMYPVEGFERHLIFYFEIENGVDIVRVLHGARDIPAVIEE